MQSWFLAVLLQLVLLNNCCAVPLSAKHVNNSADLNTSTSRVINGVPVTSRDEYPFVVDLSMHDVAISSSRFCTGTLVKPNVVLTAAHCVLNEGYSSHIFATVGRIELDDRHADNSRAETFRTIASIVHEKYTGLGSPYDVALLLLNGSSSAPLVRLATQTPAEGQEAWVVGYGIQKIGTLEETAQNVEIMSGRLQKTALRIKDSSFCDIPEANFRTAEGMLCTAGVKEGSSACKGDSGGGLFVRKGQDVTQVGVVSYGDSHCMSEESGVFTDVASVRDWTELQSTRLRNAFHPTQLYLDDNTKKVVEDGEISSSSGKAELRAQDTVHMENVKLFHVRTNFKDGRRMMISLCGGSATGAVHLSVSNFNGTLVQDSGSCPDGKLSKVSFIAARNSYVVGVSSKGESKFQISLIPEVI